MRSRVAIWKRRPMCARKPAAGSMIPKARYMTDAWMISSVDRERPRQMSLGYTAAASVVVVARRALVGAVADRRRRVGRRAGLRLVGVGDARDGDRVAHPAVGRDRAVVRERRRRVDARRERERRRVDELAAGVGVVADAVVAGNRVPRAVLARSEGEVVDRGRLDLEDVELAAAQRERRARLAVDGVDAARRTDLEFARRGGGGGVERAQLRDGGS